MNSIKGLFYTRVYNPFIDYVNQFYSIMSCISTLPEALSNFHDRLAVLEKGNNNGSYKTYKQIVSDKETIQNRITQLQKQIELEQSRLKKGENPYTGLLPESRPDNNPNGDRIRGLVVY